MANRHSHAIVLSNYESRGLMYFPFLSSRPEEEEWVIKKAQPDDTSSQHHERADKARTASLTRLRLGTPSPPVSEEVLHKRSDTSSTVITQILAPRTRPDDSEEAEEAEEEEWHFANGWTDHRLSQDIESRPAEHPQDQTQQSQDQTSSKYVSYGTMTEYTPDIKLEKQNPRASYSSHTRSNTQGRSSSDTAIYTPETFATPPQTADGPPPNEVSALSRFQRPLSPPLTPDGLTLSHNPAMSYPTENTTRPASFSAAIKEQGHPPPKARPSTATYSEPVHNLSFVSRPQTSTGTSTSNNSSIPARISTSHRPNFSIGSGHAPTFASLSSIQSIEGTFTTDNHMPTELFFDSSPRTSAEFDDRDLPAVLASKIDYDIMPWENAKYRNALPSALRRAPSQSTSLRSSFDSAAPPPISLSRLQPPPKQSKPTSKLSPPQPHQTHQTIQQPQPSKPHKSFPKSISSLFHQRTPSPLLSVAYQNTTAGTPPLEISVSRTSVPSIPALFPKHKGPWPPRQDPVAEKGARTRLQSRRISLKAQASGTGGGGEGEVQRDPKVFATVQGGLPPPTNTSISQHKAPMPELTNSAPQVHPLINESLIPQIPLSAQQSSQIAKLLLTTNPTVPAIGEEVVPKRQSWLSNKAPYRVGELEEMIWGNGVGSGGRGREIAPGLM